MVVGSLIPRGPALIPNCPTRVCACVDVLFQTCVCVFLRFPMPNSFQASACVVESCIVGPEKTNNTWSTVHSSRVEVEDNITLIQLEGAHTQ